MATIYSEPQMEGIAPQPIDAKDAIVTSTVSEVRSPSPTANDIGDSPSDAPIDIPTEETVEASVVAPIDVPSEIAAEEAPEFETSSMQPMRHGKKRPPPKKDQPPPVKKPGKPEDPIVIQPHPIPPSGDVFQDVRVHLRCQKMFALNVEQLIAQYEIMRVDLEATRAELRTAKDTITKLKSDLFDAEQESQQWRDAYEDAKARLKTTREELRRAIEDLGNSKKANQKLQEQYDHAQGEIRNLKEIKRDLLRGLEQAKSDIRYYQARIADLEEKLKKANDSENLANDRNTELTRLLFEAESKKSAIERLKDSYEKTNRELKDNEKELTDRIEKLREKLRHKFHPHGEAPGIPGH